MMKEINIKIVNEENDNCIEVVYQFRDKKGIQEKKILLEINKKFEVQDSMQIVEYLKSHENNDNVELRHVRNMKEIKVNE